MYRCNAGWPSSARPSPGLVSAGQPDRDGYDRDVTAETWSHDVPRSPATAGRRLGATTRAEQILAAARRVFLDNGFSGARTKDIAAEAGVNEALIYRYFASKEALFEAAVVAPLDSLVDGLVGRVTNLRGGPRPEIQFELTAEFIEGLLRAMVEMAPMLGVVLFGDLEVGREFYQEKLLPTLEIVESAVVAGLDTFDHRTFQVATAVRSTLWACFGLALDARFRASPLDVEQVARELTTLVFEGIAPEPR